MDGWVVVGSFILMCGAGFLANYKNRRIWLWMVLTFLFGFFALIPLAVMKKVRDEADFKKCPACGEEILAVAKVCKHCGTAQ